MLLSLLFAGSSIMEKKLMNNLSVVETELEVRRRLVGTWRLVSTEETLKRGGTRPFPQFGPNGKGFLMYQADGHMCAFLENPNRPKWGDPARATLNQDKDEAEKAPAGDATFAYCGRYEIDVERKQIVHLPEIATTHGYAGLRQVRPYQFDGERLIFSDLEKDDPEVASWTIVWEKVI